MDTTSQKTLSQGLGIAGLVLSILTLLISFIPCVGVLALVTGTVALIVSAIGLVISIKYKQSQTLAIIALILAFIGLMIAGLQYFVLSKFVEGIPNQRQKELPYVQDTDTIVSTDEAEDVFLQYQEAGNHDNKVE